MKAHVIPGVMRITPDSEPLHFVDMPQPRPRANEILLRVRACGVCHTELDEIEGRTPPPRYPMIPGHQIIGTVEECGSETHGFTVGDRVGVAWINSACGECAHCIAGNDNLCARFVATGRDVHGGYAEYAVVPARYAFMIPDLFRDEHAAPLMCAGAIGYRSLRLACISDGNILGLTGFGASAHLVLSLAKFLYPNSLVFVFARSEAERTFARERGAHWTGSTDDAPPASMHAVIDTTPAWKPFVAALKHVEPGGRLVINAIRKEEADKAELLALDYASHLWMEKEIKSVANVASRDVREFLDVAARIPITPEVQCFPFEDANAALRDLKQRNVRGAKVLMIT